MGLVLYESPKKIELIENALFVDGKQHPKDIRSFQQMRDTMMEDAEGNEDVYYMYRGVHQEGDIRFDITVIPSRNLGEECAKTYGHYHEQSPDGKDYPEIYQVLNGKAVYLLQKRNSNGSVDVIIVDAKKGDIVLMPPDYGHVTINNGSETLVMSNLVYGKFKSLYDEYKRNKGGAYYYTKDHELVQNTNYIIHLNERIKPAELNGRYEIEAKDLLKELIADPHKFAFLEKPGML